jgi:tetratricopeptide (TPR) repeat protein
MLADYERMIVGDLDPSAIVERQIADLERSVEPKLNQSEDYIKLGEAYEEAGEREKAEEVYRRAREMNGSGAKQRHLRNGVSVQLTLNRPRKKINHVKAKK